MTKRPRDNHNNNDDNVYLHVTVESYAPLWCYQSTLSYRYSTLPANSFTLKDFQRFPFNGYSFNVKKNRKDPWVRTVLVIKKEEQVLWKLSFYCIQHVIDFWAEFRVCTPAQTQINYLKASLTLHQFSRWFLQTNAWLNYLKNSL